MRGDADTGTHSANARHEREVTQPPSSNARHERKVVLALAPTQRTRGGASTGTSTPSLNARREQGVGVVVHTHRISDGVAGPTSSNANERWCSSKAICPIKRDKRMKWPAPPNERDEEVLILSTSILHRTRNTRMVHTPSLSSLVATHATAATSTILYTSTTPVYGS